MSNSPCPLINSIFDFNEQVVKVADTQINPLDKKRFDWTIKFCEEELEEFGEAYDNQDVVKMVDGICDLIYGAMGTLRKMGLTRQQAYDSFMAIHAANMTKVKGEVANRGGDEDATKPADFVPPDQAIGHILFGA